MKIDEDIGRARADEGYEETADPLRQDRAEKRAGNTEQETFHEQLPDEAPAGCTERKAHCDFALAGAGARKQRL